MGRPTKLTNELLREIRETLETGCSRRTAARAAGISESTFYEWMAEFPEFSECIKKGEALAVVKRTQVVHEAMSKSWQAAALWLERRVPDEFGRKATEAVLNAEQVRNQAEEIKCQLLDAITKEISDPEVRKRVTTRLARAGSEERLQQDVEDALRSDEEWVEWYENEAARLRQELEEAKKNPTNGKLNT